MRLESSLEDVAPPVIRKLFRDHFQASKLERPRHNNRPECRGAEIRDDAFVSEFASEFA